MHCKTLNEIQQMLFLYEGNTIPRTHPQYQGHLTITIKHSIHPEHASTQNGQTSSCLLSLEGYYRKFIKNFAKITKPLMLLICQQVKFDWTPIHHNAFLTLRELIIQAPIL